MNKEWVLFHQQEALKEIEDTIKEIESQSDCDDHKFSLAITHLYHHVNTVLNSRHFSIREVEEPSKINFSKWCQFLTDVDVPC